MKNTRSKERREREREEMQEKILAAAMHLFLSEGYDSVTIRRIADEVSYTPGAIYSYFADKEEIVFELCNRAAAILNGMFKPLMLVAHPFERLMALGRVYMQFALEHRNYYDLMFIMSAPAPKMVEKGWEEGLKAFYMLRQTVQECIDAGHLPPTDADIAAFSMWSFVHGGVSLFIRSRMHMIPEEQHESILYGSLSFMLQAMIGNSHYPSTSAESATAALQVRPKVFVANTRSMVKTKKNKPTYVK
jgi:AcrR family transcriptional regulator